MEKARPINDLLKGAGKVARLRAELAARAQIKEAVCAALAPPLGQAVVSAGLEAGELTVGVTGAGWASRLRYGTEALCTELSRALGVPVERVRIRVVPSAGRARSER